VRHAASLGLIVLLTALSGGTQQAHAFLRICNQANFRITVALGFVERQGDWAARGWQPIEGGECKDVIRSSLHHRYYFFFAAGRGPGGHIIKYEGDTSFCVDHTKFRVYRSQYGENTAQECSKAGLRSELFRKLDVNNATEFTINLGGPVAAPGPTAAPPSASDPPPPVQIPPAQVAPAQVPPAQVAPSQVPPPPVAAPPNRQPPAASAQPPNPSPSAPPTAPGSGESGGACQRYPDLC
jgi:uncharacterized membrane protein